MRATYRAVRRAHRRDEGVSLFELLVVMSIFIVVMAACFQILAAVQKQTGDNLSQVEAVQMARLGLANVDRQLRSAETLVAPSATRIRAYIGADGNPRCVEFNVTTAGELQMRSWTSPTSITPWRTIATRLANTATTAPFTATPAADPNYVVVRLLVKPSTGTARPIEVTTALTKRNAPAAARSTLCDTTTVP